MTRLLTIILTVLFSVSAMASMHEEEKEAGHQGQEDSLPAFSEVDANEDQWLSWEEAKSLDLSKEEFESADYDDDGKISRTMYEYSLKEEQI